MQADVVFCPILRKIRFFQHHAIPGPSWIDPMTMIFYSPVEKSYISLLSKKNDETIPLSLKKKFMHRCIHMIHTAGQTSGVFFKSIVENNFSFWYMKIVIPSSFCREKIQFFPPPKAAIGFATMIFGRKRLQMNLYEPP